MRLLGLRILALAFAAWVVLTAVVAAQQRATRQPDPCNAELLILREQITNATALNNVQAANLNAIAAVNQKLAVVEKSAGDALDEVKEMRKLIYGIAATLLVSLLMQVAQIKRGTK